MNVRMVWILLVVGMLSASSFAQDVNISTADTTGRTATNRAVYDRVAAALQPVAQTLPMSELVVQVALQLIGTPYMWASLESEPEQLQVFLDKTDCILFVELSACMALTLKANVLCRQVTANILPYGEHPRWKRHPPAISCYATTYATCAIVWA